MIKLRLILCTIMVTLSFASVAKYFDVIENPDQNITRFPFPLMDELPEDIKASFIATQKRLGFVPNVHFALAHRPDEYRAFMAYAKALATDCGLSKAEQEMIIIATSNDNGCQYCVMSHGAKLRIVTKDPMISDRVAVNYQEADLSPRHVAMIDFAMKVSKDSRSINEADFALLHSHGFSDEDIWDIASLISFFGLSNRMMNLAAVRPDEEFFMMGRR